MRPRLPHPRQRTLAASFVLVVILLRAYVPLGYMPASGTAFQLEICPQGLHAQMPVHICTTMAGDQPHFEDCPFGSAPATGPISHLVIFEPAAKLFPPQYPRFHPCGWVYDSIERIKLADRRPSPELNFALLNRARLCSTPCGSIASILP